MDCLFPAFQEQAQLLISTNQRKERPAPRLESIGHGASGHENFSINSCQLHVGELNELPDAPPNVACGNEIEVATEYPEGRETPEVGTISVTGQIFTLKIGGQELFVDNICFSE